MSDYRNSDGRPEVFATGMDWQGADPCLPRAADRSWECSHLASPVYRRRNLLPPARRASVGLRRRPCRRLHAARSAARRRSRSSSPPPSTKPRSRPLRRLGARGHHAPPTDCHRYGRRAPVPQSRRRTRDALAQFGGVGLRPGGALPGDRRRPAGRAGGRQLRPGDLWYFPRATPRDPNARVRALPRHPGIRRRTLYSEHGTFGISDWMSRYDSRTLARALGGSPEALGRIPKARRTSCRAMCCRWMARRRVPRANSTASERTVTRSWRRNRWSARRRARFHIGSARDFPKSATMTGMAMTLRPGAMHEPHWHPNANEWHYVARGRARVTLFAVNKQMAVAELSPGDCRIFPAAAVIRSRTLATRIVRSSAHSTAESTPKAHCRNGWPMRLAICLPTTLESPRTRYRISAGRNG